MPQSSTPERDAAIKLPPHLSPLDSGLIADLVDANRCGSANPSV